MGRFVTLDGAATGPAIHVADPPLTLSEIIVDPHDVWRSQPSVRKVVDFIARNLASIPLHLYRRDDDNGRTRVRVGDLAELLRQPGPRQTPYRFWHSIHVDGLLWDRWAAVVLDATDTDPRMLLRIPPKLSRLERTTFGQPKTLIVWGKDGAEYHLDPSTAVFDSGYSSAWGDPVPPMQTLADTLHEATEATKFRRDLLKNGARVGAVIERPVEAGDWDDTAWNRFRSQFAAYRGGGGDAGGVPILEDGMKLKAVEAFEPQNLQTLEARKLTDAEVAAFYHVPPEMVGAREGTFANLDAFRQMLWSITLGPAITAWEQAADIMLRPLVDDTPGLYIEAHVDAKLRGSFIEQAAATQSAVGAPIMTRNEARAQRNMTPIDGGDDIVTPLNVLVGGLASPRDTAPKGEAGAGKGRGRVKATRPDGLGNADSERAAMTDRIAAYWKNVAAGILAEMGPAKAVPDLGVAFNETAVAAGLSPILRAHMQRLAEVGAWEVLEEWNPESDGWSPDLVEAWIATAAQTNSSRWTTGMRNALTEATLGTDPEAGLRAFLEGDGVTLAIMLAVAFGTEALSFGGSDAARKSGLGTKTWVVTSRNPRPGHAALDGVTVRLDDVFDNGMRWPGEWSGGAENVANCMCELRFGRS